MMKFSSPTAFMAQKKEILDEAYAGDIVGLPDNGGTLNRRHAHFGRRTLLQRPAQLLARDVQIHRKCLNPMKSKQLQKGVDQLMDEGVAQLFTNQFNGRKIIGTVGQLQFEVIQYRLLHEYGAQCRWDPINLYKACWVESDDDAQLADFKKRKYQYMAYDKQGRDVFLAESNYILMMAQQDFKNIRFHFNSEY